MEFSAHFELGWSGKPIVPTKPRTTPKPRWHQHAGKTGNVQKMQYHQGEKSRLWMARGRADSALCQIFQHLGTVSKSRGLSFQQGKVLVLQFRVGARHWEFEVALEKTPL